MIVEYVQKIKEWPVPKTGKEGATFLGFASYYRTFIPQCSALINWLNRIKKAEKFLWNEEIEQDFIELKKAFTNGRIQAFPDFGVGDPFILTTRRYRTARRDSSDVGEGSGINMSRIIPVAKGSC